MKTSWFIRVPTTEPYPFPGIRTKTETERLSPWSPLGRRLAFSACSFSPTSAPSSAKISKPPAPLGFCLPTSLVRLILVEIRQGGGSVTLAWDFLARKVSEEGEGLGGFTRIYTLCSIVYGDWVNEMHRISSPQSSPSNKENLSHPNSDKLPVA